MGGGESDDRDMREPGVSWWDEEMPNAEEIKNAEDNLRDSNYIEFNRNIIKIIHTFRNQIF